jgi:hypothetical protein
MSLNHVCPDQPASDVAGSAVLLGPVHLGAGAVLAQGLMARSSDPRRAQAVRPGRSQAAIWPRSHGWRDERPSARRRHGRDGIAIHTT